MPAWLSIIGGVIQILAMVLKNKFETDAEERNRKNDLHSQWADVIKSRDVNRINDMLNRMRS